MTPAATAHSRAAAPVAAQSEVELDVIPVGEDGWRVSIRHADRGNPFALLGFVTRVGGRYEVCVIGHLGDAVSASSLDAAVEVLRPAPGEVEEILSGVRH